MGIAKDFIVKNGLQANGLVQTTANAQANQFLSTAPQGTAPFTVQSNTVVANLNAAFVGGIPAASLPSLAGNNAWTGTETFSNGVTVSVSGSGSNLTVNSVISSPSIIYNQTGNASFLISYQGNGVARGFLQSTNTGLVLTAANSTGGITGAVNAITIGLLNGNVTIGGTLLTVGANTLLNGTTITANAAATFQNTATFQGVTSFGNSTANVSISVGGVTTFANATATSTIQGALFSGTANNATNLGGVAPSSYFNLTTQQTILAGTIWNNVANAEIDVQFQGNGIMRGYLFSSNTAFGYGVANATGNNIGSALRIDNLTGNVTIGSIAGSQTFLASPATLVGTGASITTIQGGSLVVSANASFSQPLSIGNSTVNTTVNSTAFTGTANNASNLGGTAAAAFAQLAAVQTFTGNQTISGTLSVSGNSAFTANITSSGLVTFNANVTHATPAFFSDNTFFSGITAQFSGNALFQATATVSGNLVVSGNVYVTGSALFEGNTLVNSTTNAIANVTFQGNGVTRTTLSSTNTAFQIVVANTTGGLLANAMSVNAAGTTTGMPLTIGDGANTVVFSANSANAITLVNGALIAWGPSAPYMGVGSGGQTMTLAGNSSLIFNITAGGTAVWQLGNTGMTVLANSNFGNNIVQNAKLQHYTEVFTSNVITTNAATLDLSTVNIFGLTLQNAAVTLTLSNPPATGNAFSFTVVLTQDATGGRTVTWPAAVKFVNGVTPTLQAGATKSDVFTLVTFNGGTTYGATYAMANVAI